MLSAMEKSKSLLALAPQSLFNLDAELTTKMMKR
jgi:hypothetical protein